MTPWIPFTNTVEGQILAWQHLFPCHRERDEALNAALISAFLSCSQGTTGSEKPDISQSIRFSSVFFLFIYFFYKMNCICLFICWSLCERKHFVCMFDSQFYKNTICCFEVIQILCRYVIYMRLSFSFLVPVWWKAFLSEYMYCKYSIDISIHANLQKELW